LTKYQNLGILLIYFYYLEETTMPKIRPSADLRNNYNEISDFCHKSSEPVFITKNGRGDLAVMSVETYEHLSDVRELYMLLEEGEIAENNGHYHSSDEAFDKIYEDIENGKI
jgi:prevent-host-death family protein